MAAQMGMGASLAEELYSESLKISKKDLGSSLTSISKESDSHGIDSIFKKNLSGNLMADARCILS